jgi:hypothetical protein
MLWAATPRRREPLLSAARQTDDSAPRAESVSTLLSMVEDMLDDELQRGRDLDSKMSTLAGFSGTILALTASIATNLLALRISSTAEVVVRSLFVLAVVSLAGAAVLAICGALLPRRRILIATSAVKEFASFPLIAAPRLEIEGQLLRTLIDALEFERSRNDRKARLGRAAGAVLIIGFIAVASLGLTRVFSPLR